MKIHGVLLPVLLLGSTALWASADPDVEETGSLKLADHFSVYNIYSDHMVLQREKPLVIAGEATAGESVTVTLENASVPAVANADGQWTAEFPAMAAGGPYSITVSGSNQAPSLTFQDVMIGEVWFCSGQSNMAMPVFSPGNPVWSSQNGEAEAEASEDPNLRLFQVPCTVAPFGEKTELQGNGSWQICSSPSVRGFSAAGYYFGRELRKNLKVPVGLINSSWGGTRVEAWMRREVFEDLDNQGELEAIRSAKMSEAEIAALTERRKQDALAREAQWFEDFYFSNPELAEAAQNWAKPDCNVSDWKTVTIPFSDAVDFDGIIWYRQSFELPEALRGKALELSLGAIDDCDETFWNGVKVGETNHLQDLYWATQRKYQIPAELTQNGSVTLAIRIADFYGPGGIADIGQSVSEVGNPSNKMMLSRQWSRNVEQTADLKKIGMRPSTDAAIPDCQQPNFPCTLFNGMVAPWTRYPVRGFIWYQGESNAGDAIGYMKNFPAMIQDWRKLWRDETMPFLFVQLAPYVNHVHGEAKPEYVVDPAQQPSENAWASLREVQTATLKLPATGQAVIIDDNTSPYDIHPRNKQLVGKRLAAEAMRLAYQRNIGQSVYLRQAEFQDGKAILTFRNVSGGLKLRDGETTPGEFAIAGADGVFVWADAKIVDGNKIEVWSDKVANPVAVRYAWSQYPIHANIQNKLGFPLSPFRTDTPDYLLK